ncbi:hypothetical protein C823_002372 [Eubacterium plexicaudatum ASF492]|uniref:Uncharacterized protein n=1 Tax=Eubacterium plexicaudatum ASF492 TaxID=1235802 RepID=N2BM91_9FIRM|nr:hypothetical protein C823_002372 [Eubacterium plexicaudatum ASF492]
MGRLKQLRKDVDQRLSTITDPDKRSVQGHKGKGTCKV